MGLELNEWAFNLMDVTKASIPDSPSVDGGSLFAMTADTPDSPTIYTSKSGTTVTEENGVARFSFNDGTVRFWTAASVTSLDISWVTSTGEAGFKRGMTQSEHFLYYNPVQGDHEIVIPAQFSSVAELDTGVDLPASLLLGVSYLWITTVDATETVDVGTLSTETGGDPNGLLAAASVATAGYVTATQGALANTHTDGVAQSITYTPSAGTDTAAGYIVVKYRKALGG